MTLGNALSGMFKTYFKKPLLFSGIYLIVMLPVAILQLFTTSTALYLILVSGNISSILSVAGMFLLILIVVNFIAGVLTLGGIIKATSGVLNNTQAKIGECLGYAFKKIGAYLMLSLRVFFYSLAWLLILLAIIGPMVISASAIRSAGAVLINPEDVPSSVGGIQEIPSMYIPEGMPVEYESLFNQQMPNSTSSFTSFIPTTYATGGLGMVFGAVMLVLFVIVIIRSLKAAFSFYVLFDEENISSKDALKKSIAITKGNLWRIIGYGFILSIVMALISSVFDYITGGILGSIDITTTTYTIVSVALTLIVGSILMPMPVIYFFVFYRGLTQEKKVS